MDTDEIDTGLERELQQAEGIIDKGDVKIQSGGSGSDVSGQLRRHTSLSPSHPATHIPEPFRTGKKFDEYGLRIEERGMLDMMQVDAERVAKAFNAVVHFGRWRKMMADWIISNRTDHPNEPPIVCGIHKKEDGRWGCLRCDKSDDAPFSCVFAKNTKDDAATFSGPVHWQVNFKIGGRWVGWHSPSPELPREEWKRLSQDSAYVLYRDLFIKEKQA